MHCHEFSEDTARRLQSLRSFTGVSHGSLLKRKADFGPQ
jgi:hypothetical protein